LNPDGEPFDRFGPSETTMARPKQWADVSSFETGDQEAVRSLILAGLGDRSGAHPALAGDLIGRVSAVMLCVYESLVRLARYSVGRRCRLRRCSDAEGLVSFVRWSCPCTG
jgi:hypothetical protein